jgi:hypothetical protein
MTTIQELENIDFEKYKDTPGDLIPIAKQMLNLKKFEKGIEILEKAIHFIIQKNNNDESNIECAKFYYQYADALIRKCMESDEVLAMPQNEGNKDDDDESEKPEEIEKNENKKEITETKDSHSQGQGKSNLDAILELQKNKKEEDGPVIQDVGSDEEEEAPQEDNLPVDDSDEQVALENLLFSEKIYKTYLEKYEDENPEELKTKSPEIIKLFFDLSNVYQKFGELEMCKSDFKSSIEFFTKSLEIRQKYDFKFSRAIAELYFNMATAYDFDAKLCLLSYYKTKIIMEYHLKEELNKHNLKHLADRIVVNEQDLNLSSVLTTSTNLRTNKEVEGGYELNSENVLKIEDIEELVSIISELNQKIDDVIIDINDFEKYKKEKEVLQQENKFTSDYDKSKVIDVTTLGIVRKRQRDENQENTDKEIGGKKPKNLI